jgi:hypothetical protein
MTERPSVDAGDERWPRIAVGFTLASLAAGYTLALPVAPVTLSRGDLSGLGLYLLAGFLAFVLVGLLAALPAVYLISLAEARRWRSAVYYAVAGAGAALPWVGLLTLLISVTRRYPGAAAPRAAWGMWEVATTLLVLSLPGLVGGLVYWWIAGRTAGAATTSQAPSSPQT